MFQGASKLAGFPSIAILVVLGCSGDGPATSRSPSAAIDAQGRPAQSADAVVKAVLDGLKAGKPVVVWDAMPTAHQADFNKTIRHLGAKLDPEVCERTRRNLKKAVQVLETKKDFVLESPLLATLGLNVNDLKANWTPLVNMSKTLVNSELFDAAKMKKFDCRSFLEGTGAALFADARMLSKSMKNDPLKRIEDAKVTVKTTSDQFGELLIEPSDPKAKPITIPLVVMDGKWTSGYLPLLTQLVGLQLTPLSEAFQPYRLVEWKAQYLREMDRAEKALDHLQGAKTSEEFQAVVAKDVVPLIFRATAQLKRKPADISLLKRMSYDRTKETAMVLVPGDHYADEAALAAMIKTFRGLHGSLGGPNVVDGKTVFMVAPVPDASVLAKQITVGKVTKVDMKQNMITVEVPPEADDAALSKAGPTKK